MRAPSPNQPFVTGLVHTLAGPVPQVSSDLTWRDHLGTLKVRWRIGRHNYKLDPGLYALNQPEGNSPVLTSANYKLSFDHLRRSMAGRDAWILVLDTKGVNVWCAAGKGTLGTEELARRAEASGLKQVTALRELILPQLAGPGIAAHKVKKLCGFKVIYGPVRAKDLPAFLDNGRKATPQMRMVTYNTWDRAVLIPVELMGTLLQAAYILVGVCVLGGLSNPAGFWRGVSTHGGAALASLLMVLTAGTVVAPLLLPWLPGRAFSLKGLWTGLAGSLGLAGLYAKGALGGLSLAEFAAWMVLVPAMTSYLVMDLTGSSSFTSLSGVKKEMRLAVPLQIAAGALGLALWLGGVFGFLA